jgi:hypothetical protein
MKNYKIILFTFLIVPLLSFSQKKAKDSIVEKPERPAFESSTLIENQTNVLFNKNTLEVMMQHRFGQIDGENTLLGIYGPANIRIGASYSILDWITVGYGITKKNITSDFSLKVGILEQTRSGSMPLSISYYGNAAIDGRSGTNGDNAGFLTKQDRYSYFNQLIFTRRFSPKLSLQVAPSLTHFNTVDYGYENDRIAIAFGGRYKISGQTALILDYTLPITKLDIEGQGDVSYDYSGLSFGAEFSTSAHVFHVFLTNYTGIVPQYNYMDNINKPFADFVIGFNITRRYNF